MTPEDASLPLPELPPLTEPLGSLDGETRAEAPAHEDHPFQLSGRDARVAGGTGRGADAIVIPPLVLGTPRVHGAELDGATITALGMERRLRLGQVDVVERVLVPRVGPFVLMEWAAVDPADTALHAEAPSQTPEALIVEWPMAPGTRWRASVRGLVSALGGRLIVHGFNHGPVELEAVEGPEEPVMRARVPWDAVAGVRLAIAAAGDAQAVARALRAANRTRALVQGRRATAAQIRADRLSLTSPDPALDMELEWVKLRLAAAGSGEEEYDRSGFIQVATDALAVGDPGPAQRLLSQAEWNRVPTVPGSDFELLVLLAADYLDRTGDVPLLQAQWPELREVAVALASAGAESSAGTERAGSGSPGAVRALARVAQEVGDRDMAGRLTTALGVPVDQDVPDGTSDHDPTGVLAFVRGFLGDRPDATRHRLVLRPRPPAGWDRFHIGSIHMGDASFSLHYRREGPRHIFTARQDRGAVPAHLILEPELPGHFIAARVDGRAAELSVREMGGWLRVPVQLDLDHERVLEVEMSEDHVRGSAR